MEPKSQDWHRADIKSALEKRGITLRDLSRQAGYHLIHCAMSLPVPGRELNGLLRTRWASRRRRSGRRAMAICK